MTAPSAPAITVVSGMHRSGTSLVTGCLVTGGWYVGEPGRLVPADANNPLGYFEHADVNQTADRILAALDADWASSPGPAEVGARGLGHAATLEDVVERLLQEAGGRPLVVKEPRLATLWPLWPGHLRPTAWVLPVRDPLSVARSLATRDGLPVPVGLALWEHQLRSALQGLAGRDVLVVRYEDVVAGSGRAWEGLEAFVDGAGLTGAVDPGAVRAASLVRPELDRHPAGRPDDLDLLDRRQRELWDWLRASTGYRARFDVPAALLVDSGPALEALRQMRAVRVPPGEALTDARRALARERVVVTTLGEERTAVEGELAQARTDLALATDDARAADAAARELHRELRRERDEALAERDGVLVERDEALVARDGVLMERDDALAQVRSGEEAAAELRDEVAVHRAEADRLRDDVARLREEAARVATTVEAERAADAAARERLGADLEEALAEAEALRGDLRGAEASLLVADAARHHLGVQLCTVLQRLEAIEASRAYRWAYRWAHRWATRAAGARHRLARTPSPRRGTA